MESKNTMKETRERVNKFIDDCNKRILQEEDEGVKLCLNTMSKFAWTMNQAFFKTEKSIEITKNRIRGCN
ncbi:hypothetical protein [Halalkalibacter oceani]|uniref:hypothetical protein n=1 Tax=Halalkalibacter oceani TaxID=1653776 RepID=UPI0033972E96